MAPPSTVLCLALLGLAAAAGPYGSSYYSSTNYGYGPAKPKSVYSTSAYGGYEPSQYHGGYRNPNSVSGYGTPKPVIGYGAPKSDSVIYDPGYDLGHGVYEAEAGYGAPKTSTGYGGYASGYGAPHDNSGYGSFLGFSGLSDGGFVPSFGHLSSRPEPASHSATPLARDRQNQVSGRSGLYLSWENPQHSGGQYTWNQAAGECKRLGLRLVSLASKQKEQEINRRIASAGRKVEFYWTSGQRLSEGGQFVWNDGKQTPVCNRGQQGCYKNWGPTGGAGRPQPDNREGGENCLAVLNDFYSGEGIVWHDIACHHQKHFVCEK